MLGLAQTIYIKYSITLCFKDNFFSINHIYDDNRITDSVEIKFRLQNTINSSILFVISTSNDVDNLTLKQFSAVSEFAYQINVFKVV